MDRLPTIPGLDVLSEVGRVGPTVRYRLASTRELLVLFDEGSDGAAVEAAARPWVGVAVDGLCPVESVVRHDGRVGVVVRGELGENPWQQPAWGEAETLPVLRRAASAVAALHARGLEHGALKPEGIRLLSEGEVEILPPMVLPARDEPGGDGRLPPIARDLAELADLACHLIAGAPLLRPAGLGAFPPVVAENASPATTQAIRLVLEAAARPEPTAAESVELLKRIGWAREIEAVRRVPAGSAPAASRRPAEREITATADGGDGRPARERPPRPARESSPVVPILVAVGLLVMGGALVVVGNPRAMKEFWSGDSGDEVAALPRPKDPLAPDRPSMGARGVSESAPPASASAPSTATGEDEGEVTSTALADEILADMEERRRAREARQATRTRRKSYDRTLVDEGDGLRNTAQEILIEVRDEKLSPAKKNEKLDEAIKNLEAAREKYEGFAEQFPSRARLVEGSIEDVNSLLFFAYRQKSTG